MGASGAFGNTSAEVGLAGPSGVTGAAANSEDAAVKDACVAAVGLRAGVLVRAMVSGVVGELVDLQLLGLRR